MPLRDKNTIDTVVIHCADTPNGYGWWRAADIDQWHAARGFKRTHARPGDALKHIGYHYVIEISGAVIVGRTHEEIGAHCEGFNHRSIGVCLIGRTEFTRDQWNELRAIVQHLQGSLAIAEIVGHRDTITDPEKAKDCPGFDVRAWLNGGMAPLAGHVFPTENIKWKK